MYIDREIISHTIKVEYNIWCGVSTIMIEKTNNFMDLCLYGNCKKTLEWNPMTISTQINHIFLHSMTLIGFRKSINLLPFLVKWIWPMLNFIYFYWSQRFLLCRCLNSVKLDHNFNLGWDICSDYVHSCPILIYSNYTCYCFVIEVRTSLLSLCNVILGGWCNFNYQRKRHTKGVRI